MDDYAELLCCPVCSGDFEFDLESLRCRGCDRVFQIDDGIPMLYWPNEWGGSREDVTETVKAFYEETPFPNYDDFDSVASLAAKAQQGLFARVLDQQVPGGVRIIECGCGTAQLSNFLSIANRTVFATDICVNSLRLGQRFARQQGLGRVHFVQQNLFRPVFKPESLHLVISNGVLHHTSDPFLAFQSIARLIRPGGYILVGLYHRYGRLITDARRMIFRLTGDRFKELDPNLKQEQSSSAKKRAWFADQYKHPHESKHTIGEVLRWLERTGLQFVCSIPSSRPFQPFSETDPLFEPRRAGGALERLSVELSMILRGSREGGFFIVIARKPPDQKSA